MYNQDNLTTYMRDVRKTPLLTKEEEYELSKKIKAGDSKAEEKLVVANLRFVVSVARQYQNLGVSLPDLINEGNYGLVKAAKRFDHETGNKFISYAVWWIKQSILQSINEHSRIIRLPVSLSNEILKLRKVVESDLCHAHMYPKVVSFEELSTQSGQTDNYECLDLDAITPDNLMIGNEVTLKSALEVAMDTLSPRENYIINEYFLNEEGTKTLEIIGAELNLTKERVRQIRDKALRKIRNNSSSLFSFLNIQ